MTSLLEIETMSTGYNGVAVVRDLDLHAVSYTHLTLPTSDLV
mgnify:CR=1 FL=1